VESQVTEPSPDYLKFFRMTASPTGWFVFKSGDYEFDVVAPTGSSDHVVGLGDLRTRLGVTQSGRRDFQEFFATSRRLFEKAETESWVNWPYGSVSATEEIPRG
jgi:hypothetical protein